MNQTLNQAVGASQEHVISDSVGCCQQMMPSSETKWMCCDQSSSSCLVAMSEAHQASVGSFSVHDS